MTIGPPIPEIQFDLENSRWKESQSAQHQVGSFPQCLTSGHPIDSRPFRSMAIAHPLPEIQCDLENSMSNVKVKSQGQWYPSQRSIQLTHFLFVSHQLDKPFLRYGKLNFRLGKTGFKILRKNRSKCLAEFLQSLTTWKTWSGGYDYQVL